MTRLDTTMEHFRTAGLTWAVALILALWCAAVVSAGFGRRPDGRADHSPGDRADHAPDGRVGTAARRFGPVAYLGVALSVIVVLAPSVQPWYFCWALPFVGLVVLNRALVGFLLGSSIGLVAMVAPGGRGVQMSPQIIGVIALSALIGWVTVRGLTVGRATWSVAGDDDPDRAGAGVRTDRGADL